MKTDATTWFCFRTPPQQEGKATDMLRKRKFDVILLVKPELNRLHRKERHRRVRKREALPAFRPYIFVDMGAPDAWSRLHEAPIEIRPVGVNGHEPRPISQAGLAFLRSPERGLYLDTDVPDGLKAKEAEVAFKPGDNVTVFGGGFDGITGPVVQVYGEDARVLLPLFGSTFPVTVPIESIVKSKK